MYSVRGSWGAIAVTRVFIRGWVPVVPHRHIDCDSPLLRSRLRLRSPRCDRLTHTAASRTVAYHQRRRVRGQAVGGWRCM